MKKIIESKLSKTKDSKQTPSIIGWREWLSLPELKIKNIKAKIDTGAKTSALHAFDIEIIKKGKKKFVNFKIHPEQRNQKKVIKTQSELIEQRLVKNSGGKVTLRPVIITEIKLGPLKWNIEITLVNRDEMGFRMLLGRDAIKNFLLVNPGKSFLIGKKKRRKK